MLLVIRLLLATCFLPACTVTAVDPLVDLSYSKFTGTALSNGITQWLGLPFAAPPTGDLRFAPPADPPSDATVRQANIQGPLCIGTGPTTIPSTQSEDCLYLAVYAPSIATPQANLPVFVFIQGGGFNSDSNPNLNGTGLIQASGNNIIVVTFNYRVGPWGFLASSASSSGQPTANNGLRDQRKAFEWVQKHISAFGGNPNHVVIGGDSAGAASVALHLTAYGGRNDNLFHAAAAESVSFATVLTPAESQYQYDNFAEAAGCSDNDATKSLSCLKSKPAAELQAVNQNIPYPGQSSPPLYMFGPTLDSDIVTDLTYIAFQKGNFINVPVIVGDDTNGGTIFTPKDTNSQDESNEFLTTQFPYLTTSQLSEIDELFPNPDQAQCPSDSCWWRQVSNAYGELRYMCPSLYISSAYANISSSPSSTTAAKVVTPKIRAVNYFVGGGSVRSRRAASANNDNKYFLGAIARSSTISRDSSGNNVKSYAYRYNVEDPDQISSGLGVPHTVELNAIFGPDNVPAGAAPKSYFPGQENANVVPVIQAYWTSFIRTFDPNTYKLEGSAEWYEYYGSQGEPQRLLFNTGGTTTMEDVDAGQRARCAYFLSIGPSIKQK